MIERFRAMSLLGQLVVLLIALLALSVMLQIVLGILKALLPLAFFALIVLGLLWLFDQTRSG
jgi:hypothetical protein